MPSRAGSVSVAALNDDSFVIAWPQCVDAPTAGCDIFAQRFVVSGKSDCSGDCNGDGVVTIDELIKGINLALPARSDAVENCLATIDCPAMDTDLDCQVTITDLVAAVSRALEGCQ